ncbi:MAG: aldehyde dehydrogenase family protein [Actinobacteria bacterium]|nr:aldehyde dehydrogenase family protein [Actinomycetota bacterium]NBY15152.1 aldehyde dehydrogenase family protein [Actinomycetota bacterium]
MKSAYPFWIAGKATVSDQIVQVNHPTGGLVAEHYLPTDDDVERAVAAAWSVRHEAAATSAAKRAAALMHVSNQLQARHEEVARIITDEGGKPIMWSRVEVNRAISTFRWAAEEARRFGGELQRIDTDATSEGRIGVIRRFPLGPVLGIAPFNFPLNLVAHKVAPALAVGAPIIIKPAAATPISALILGEILSETDLPAGMWSILPISREATSRITTDERLPILSFTGSDTVGYEIQKLIPHKHVILELGGNAAAVVLDDWSSEQDIEFAATRIATFGASQAGQSCISVQRVIIHDAIYDKIVPKIVDKTQALTLTDAYDEKTVVGPLINEANAQRVEQWVDEAVAGGAKVLTGGQRDGAYYQATVLTDVPGKAKVSACEVFGPVIVLTRVKSTEEAFAVVNDSDYGLQAGVFTHDIQTAFLAQSTLEVGGVIIGDVPAFRADHMPYGGLKNSGVGKEGVRWAMEDLTHERIMVLTDLTL